MQAADNPQLREDERMIFVAKRALFVPNEVCLMAVLLALGFLLIIPALIVPVVMYTRFQASKFRLCITNKRLLYHNVGLSGWEEIPLSAIIRFFNYEYVDYSEIAYKEDVTKEGHYPSFPFNKLANVGALSLILDVDQLRGRSARDYIHVFEQMENIDGVVRALANATGFLSSDGKCWEK